MDIIVDLNLAEMHQMVDAAKHRWITKLGSKDKATYAEGRKNKYLEHDLLSSLRSATTEWAVAKYLHEGWVGQITYPNSEHGNRKSLGDVGAHVEVRSRRTRDAIPVWDYDIVPGKILVGTEVVNDDTFNQIRIFGWMMMTDVPANSEFYEGRYYVPTEKFNTDFSLLKSSESSTSEAYDLAHVIDLIH